MAEIVQKIAPRDDGNPLGFLQTMADNWGYIVLAIFVIVLAIVIYVLLKKMEDERKERDDPVYQGYKNLVRDCLLNKDNKKIRKHYSWINLLWLGIPIKWKEHSNVIVDYRDRPMGWYRGHSYSQDHYFNIVAYKSKYLLFFEDMFLIRCPLQVDKIAYSHDENGKRILDVNGKFKTEKIYIDYQKWNGQLPNGDIKIRCTGLQKLSYFEFPAYLDEELNVIDLRKDLNQDIVDLSHDQMLSRVLSTGATYIEKAMEHNPYVKFNQKSPEKTKTEQAEDNTS